MAVVKVHRLWKYDIVSDTKVESTRMATAGKIKSLCAEIIPGTEIEIDESCLIPMEEWTQPKFEPPKTE